MSVNFRGLGGESSWTKTISVTSGKGGVGKSSLVANWALWMARRGERVLLLDGDLGMANLDIICGVRSSNSLSHVLRGEKSLQEILVEVMENVYLIPGGSGMYSIYNLDLFQKRRLMEQVEELGEAFDVMLIDTAPGISENVLYLNAAAQEIVVVVTPEPSSLTDAYALIKVLHQEKKESRFSIVCNRVKDETEGKRIYELLVDTASRFLCVNINYLGYIFE